MAKRSFAAAAALLGAVLAAALGSPAVAAAPAGTAAAPTRAAAAPDFHATLKLPGCSGSLVRMPDSAGSDPALAMTNGHCYDLGALRPGVVHTDRPADESFGLLDGAGDQAGTVHANRMLYATMTDTDVAVYRLDRSYADITSATGVQPLTVSATRPAAGDGITVASGYFAQKWTCSIDSFVYRLKEDAWTWKDSIRYTPECTTKHGTSGSPVIADDGSTVVGINNTGNDDGQRCTLNNPCEVDEQGNVDYAQGRTYGQQTYRVPGCFGAGSALELDKQGCALPKPRS